MKLAGRSALVILTDDGWAVLRAADVPVVIAQMAELDIVESEDLGLWIRYFSQDRQELYLLLRWDYILSIVVEEQARKVVGLKGIG